MQTFISIRERKEEQCRQFYQGHNSIADNITAKRGGSSRSFKEHTFQRATILSSMNNLM